MDTTEPDSGMTAEELEWLRDQLQASIEHARGVLRRTELLLLAAHLAGRSDRKQAPAAPPQGEAGSLRAGTTDK